MKDLKENLSEETCLQSLQQDRVKHHKNPFCLYIILSTVKSRIFNIDRTTIFIFCFCIVLIKYPNDSALGILTLSGMGEGFLDAVG